MWRDFFGHQAVIFGIDIDPASANISGKNLHVRIGSQADKSFLHSVVQEMGGVDIVLDDGSHRASDQRATFDALFPLVSSGGMYVIEDVHTSYLWSWGGGLRRPGTIVQVAKAMVDGLHKWYFRAPVGARAKMATTQIRCIQFYDSVIAIEKWHIDRPKALRAGRESTLGPAQTRAPA